MPFEAVRSLRETVRMGFEAVRSLREAVRKRFYEVSLQSAALLPPGFPIHFLLGGRNGKRSQIKVSD